jgi:hypothetical protein
MFFHDLKILFQGVKFYFRGLKFYFNGLKILFHGLKKLFCSHWDLFRFALMASPVRAERSPCELET